jgi:3-isopropylmalate/(R)-2-methylmalate dehydratase large subunit
MSQTATEKMLEAASLDATSVRAGDTVEVSVDQSWVHETQVNIFKEKFEELGGEIWDRDKVMFMIDHFPNPSTQEQADRLQYLREYAAEKDVDVVSVGIKHQAWRMLGLARPGAIMAGPDSHTPTAGALGAFATSIGPTDTAVIWHTGQLWLTVPETIRFDISGELDDYVTPRDVGFHLLEEFSDDTAYFAESMTVEYGGDWIEGSSLDARQTLCNMGTEMGVTNSFVAPDDRLKAEYLDPKVETPYETFESDADADFAEHYDIDVTGLEPKVAFPHSPSNVHDIGEAVGTDIDRLFLGSCANGHYEDLALAADILSGNAVHPDVDLLVTPASDEIRRQLSRDDVLDTFTQAGALVSNGYCSACPGYEGVLADGEVCLATSTRNYQGRMGHRNSEIYLCSPAVLAASAIEGEIADPREVV